MSETDTRTIQPSRPSSRAFLREMVEQQVLTLDEARVLIPTGVRSPEELQGTLETFPSLGAGQAPVELPRVFNQLLERFPQQVKAVSVAREEAAFRQKADLAAAQRFGAFPPAGLAGSALEAPPPAPESMSVEAWFAEDPLEADPTALEMSELQPVDNRCKPPSQWPVRNQAYRGTCVAFASAACAEQSECEGLDLSEQYLYHAMKDKVGDPWPTTDGSLIEVAAQAFQSCGVCKEQYWPYNPNFSPGNVGQDNLPPGAPTAEAIADAEAHKRGGFDDHQPPAGVSPARHLYDLLASTHLVAAVSLPVFVDALAPQSSSNWNSGLGQLYGRVIEPASTSKIDGGHAVCITGYTPDPGAPGGGYFVLRNSWGVGWGQGLPNPTYPAPEPGYGDISAQMINRYLWELRKF